MTVLEGIEAPSLFEFVAQKKAAIFQIPSPLLARQPQFLEPKTNARVLKQVRVEGNLARNLVDNAKQRGPNFGLVDEKRACGNAGRDRGQRDRRREFHGLPFSL